MKTIRLLLLVALVAFCPARAYALEGWWDWLDALSGPGPYHGYGFGHTFCVPGRTKSADVPCWRELGQDRDNRFDQALEARLTWHFNYGDRFEDDPGDNGTVRVWALEGFYLFRLGGRYHIDVGPGVGLLRFSGKDRSQSSDYAVYRFTISPVSFSFAPFAPQGPKGSWLRLRVDSMYVPEGFTGDQFGNTVTSFETSGEFLTKLSVIARF